MADSPFVPARCFVWLWPAPNPDWSDAGQGAFMMWAVAQALVVDDTGHVEVTEATAPYGQQPLMGWLEVSGTDTPADVHDKAEAWAREATGFPAELPITWIFQSPVS